jgi:hypothetical protein
MQPPSSTIIGTDGKNLYWIDQVKGEQTTPLSPSIPTPAWFNVKSYGAKGNTKSVADGVSSGSNLISSATADFTSADIGKLCFGIEMASGIARIAQSVIASVISPTEAIVAGGVTAGYSNLKFVWGTDDTAALKAAWIAAVNAATETSAFNQNGMGVVYCPSGGYMFSYLPFLNSAQPGVSLLGDGPRKTVFYPTPKYNFSGGFTNGFGMLLQNFNGGVENEIGNFSVDGSNIGYTASGVSGCLVEVSGCPFVHDLIVENVGFSGFDAIGGIYAPESVAGLWQNVHVVACETGYSIHINGANTRSVLLNCGASNGATFTIQNVNNGTSYEGDGGALTYLGSLNDEGGNPNLEFVNCSDTTIIGCSLFGNADSTPLTVDATSDVSIFGCFIGPYSYHSETNAGALVIQEGGIVRAAGNRFLSYGSGVAVNNSGTFIDMGGNTITNSSGSGTIVSAAANTTADTAGALVGYKLEYINGTLQKIPYYAVS